MNEKYHDDADGSADAYNDEIANGPGPVTDEEFLETADEATEAMEDRLKELAEAADAKASDVIAEVRIPTPVTREESYLSLLENLIYEVRGVVTKGGVEHDMRSALRDAVAIRFELQMACEAAVFGILEHELSKPKE